MAALLDQFAAAGVRLELATGGQVRAHGDLTDELRATIRAHKPAILAELQTSHVATFYRWRIAIPGRDPFEVRVLPESTADEMRARYPGATAESIPD